MFLVITVFPINFTVQLKSMKTATSLDCHNYRCINLLTRKMIEMQPGSWLCATVTYKLTSDVWRPSSAYKWKEIVLKYIRFHSDTQSYTLNISKWLSGFIYTCIGAVIFVAGGHAWCASSIRSHLNGWILFTRTIEQKTKSIPLRPETIKKCQDHHPDWRWQTVWGMMSSLN